MAAARRCNHGKLLHALPARRSATSVQVARLSRVARVSGCSGPRTRSRMGSSAANWSRAPAASPACPVHWARLARVVRVPGCSGPRTRSRTGSSAANWSRAPAGSPPARSSFGEVGAGGQGFRVLLGRWTRSRTGSSAADRSRAAAGSPARPVKRANSCLTARVSGCSEPRTRSHTGKQRGELVPSAGRVSRLPGPSGEVVPGDQGVRALRAQDPLAHGQQRGGQVPGGGRVPAIPVQRAT